MQEKIYTIPVNEAFEQTDDCPFCVMYNKLESNEIDLITGASMMEPDIRIKTNELGFCRDHFEKMFAKPQRLPLAL
ncbi:MAG: ABC transporter substrate-binding protein, partial [Clostridia bacterium]|nr:ABC transporter substrate-binding protein [Clostridia bacterium]